MKPVTLRLFLLAFVLLDHGIWFLTDFASSVAVSYVAGLEVFRVAILATVLTSVRTPLILLRSLRWISVYAFCTGVFVVAAYYTAVTSALTGPSWAQNLLSFWRVPVQPSVSAYVVALTCVGYLVVNSLLIPRSRRYQ